MVKKQSLLDTVQTAAFIQSTFPHRIGSFTVHVCIGYTCPEVVTVCNFQLTAYFITEQFVIIRLCFRTRFFL